MNITKVYIDGFKNLREIDISLDKKLNIFYGQNAQGKTNLIEAMWICSGCRSFRGTKDKDLIRLDGEISKINLSFQNKIREQEIEYSMARPNVKDKKITLNGVKLATASKLFGHFQCVVFTPIDLDLVKSSPDVRRSFLDLCIGQIKIGYGSVVSNYETTLQQRNILLKNISQGISNRNELEVWDIQLAKLGAYITFMRCNYAKKLNIFAKKMYNEISLGNEELELSYHSSVYKKNQEIDEYNEKMTEDFYSILKKSERDDIRLGFTQYGIHRDDLISKINSLSAKDFGSQGQQRSIALILKLSQAYILMEETDDAPCILLDDVLSELDKNRQTFVLSSIEKMQVLITCCDIDNSLLKDKGKLFNISNGRIV